MMTMLLLQIYVKYNEQTKQRTQIAIEKNQLLLQLKNSLQNFKVVSDVGFKLFS